MIGKELIQKIYLYGNELRRNNHQKHNHIHTKSSCYKYLRKCIQIPLEQKYRMSVESQKKLKI